MSTSTKGAVADARRKLRTRTAPLLSRSTIKLLYWSAAELVARVFAVEGVSAKRAARVYIRRAFSWGSLLLTARPGGEIRTPNLRIIFDVTGFRASALETKETAEIKQSRISGEQILSSTDAFIRT
jgi:hypothetical protein